MRSRYCHNTLLISRIHILYLIFSLTSVCLSAQRSVRFSLLADIHLSPGVVAGSFTKVIEDINTDDTDFVIVAGDITNVGSDEEFLAVKDILDGLKKPLFILPGNHETNWSESGGLTFNKLWGDDRFFFSRNGFTFAGYNTGPFMKMGDGFVKQEDLHWLERRLKEDIPEGNILISVSHYPLTEGLSNWPEVTGLLKSAGCRLSFCGHGHRLSLHNFNGIQGVMCRALSTGNTGSAGYNIVQITSDSVLVYDKIPGIVKGPPALKFRYSDNNVLSGLGVPSLPDYDINDMFPARHIEGKWDDSASIMSGACLVDDTLLIYGNSAGVVKAISTLSGKQLWHIRIAGPVYSTPVETGGILVLGTVDGEIIGLNACSGSILWKLSAGRPVMSEGIAEGKFVYIGGGDRSFLKIDVETGKIVWEFTGVKGLIQGKPVIYEESVLFGAWDTYFYCIDKASGMLKWKWNNGKPQKLYSPGNIYPVCSNGRVFIAAPDRYMTALDIATGREVWRTARHQVRESLGISSDGEMVFAKLMNDTVIAVSASEDVFRTIWKADAGFGYEHSPCPLAYDDGKVLAATRNGLLIAIDAKTGKIIWKYKSGNSIVNKILTDSRHNYWITLANGRVMGIK